MALEVFVPEGGYMTELGIKRPGSFKELAYTTEYKTEGTVE